MNVKNDEERKSKVIKIRLNDAEFAKLKRYTEESGLRSMSEYVYNSILATPIIEITDEQLAPLKARLRTIADSINAIAIRVNQTNKIYPEDLQEIKKGIAEIQDGLAEYRAKLESLAITPKTFRAIVDKAHDEVKSKLSKK
ncbi:MAG: hypothetical protein IK999_09070 [Ruminococcus sp.]|nr:hypothetical protein [Ruminococcus sp.]